MAATFLSRDQKHRRSGDISVAGRYSLSFRPFALFAAIILAFVSLSVYYVLMEPGQAAAASNATASGTYYYTLDHIGRPFNLRDSTRTLRWYEHHYAFGDSIEEETVNGLMYAGAGHYAITWKPDFRFPGQYEEVDMYPFVQNHFREYMPEYGTYNSLDRLGSGYLYPSNPIISFDPYGLYGTTDCSYYDQRYIDTMCEYYQEAKEWCIHFRQVDNLPGGGLLSGVWSRCTRKCLQDYDASYCKGNQACPDCEAISTCNSSGHRFCYIECRHQTANGQEAGLPIPPTEGNGGCAPTPNINDLIDAGMYYGEFALRHILF